MASWDTLPVCLAHVLTQHRRQDGSCDAMCSNMIWRLENEGLREDQMKEGGGGGGGGADGSLEREGLGD